MVETPLLLKLKSLFSASSSASSASTDATTTTANTNSNGKRFKRTATLIKLVVDSSAKDRDKLVKDVICVLKKGADADAADCDGRPLIVLAAITDRVDIVKALVKYGGADVNRADKCLHWAAYKNHTECLEVLLANGADTNCPDMDGSTALILASLLGHADCVKALLSKRADVHLADNQGYSALDCCYNGPRPGHGRCSRLLLANGASEDHVDAYLAAQEGCVDTLMALAKTLDLNRRFSFGPATLLAAAAENGNLECVRFLILKGANIHLAGYCKRSPVYIAAANGHRHIVEVLADAGADLNCPDYQDWTPLHAAANKGHTDCVRVLLEQGAHVDPANRNGKTPLVLALAKSNIEATEFLLSYGAVEPEQSVHFDDDIGVEDF